MNNTSMSMGLLENGLDFILSAVEHLAGNPDQRKLKYAVLHLMAGVELILKERLRQKQTELIFKDRKKKVSQVDYASGNFISVYYEEAVVRLRDDCGITFSPSEEAILKALKDKRNRMEHFHVVDTRLAVGAETANVVSIILKFIDAHLDGSSMAWAEKSILADIRRGLAEVQAFVRLRWNEIRSDVDALTCPVIPCELCGEKALAVFDEEDTRCYFCDGGLMWLSVCECPECHEVSLLYGSDPVRCPLCNWSANAETATRRYAGKVVGVSWRDIKDGEDDPVHKCPECEAETLVYDRNAIPSGNAPVIQSRCFACGEKWKSGQMDWCDVCGEPFPKEEGFGSICQSCFGYKVSKD